MTSASSAGSTGFGTCMLYPAERARIRSSVLAYAVSAMAGMWRSAASLSRTFCMKAYRKCDSSSTRRMDSGA